MAAPFDYWRPRLPTALPRDPILWVSPLGYPVSFCYVASDMLRAWVAREPAVAARLFVLCVGKTFPAPKGDLIAAELGLRAGHVLTLPPIGERLGFAPEDRDYFAHFLWGNEALPALLRELRPAHVVCLGDTHILAAQYASMAASLADDGNRTTVVHPYLVVDADVPLPEPLASAILLGDPSVRPFVATDFAAAALVGRGTMTRAAGAATPRLPHLLRPSFAVATGGRRVPRGPADAAGAPRTFVVGTVQCNHVRKRLDLTLEVYRRFADDPARTAGATAFALKTTGVAQNNYAPAVNFDPAALCGKHPTARVVAALFGAAAMPEAVYAQLDVFLSTSSGEGFGLTPLEAVCCGVPALVPDYGPSRELLGHGYPWLLAVNLLPLGYVRRAVALLDPKETPVLVFAKAYRGASPWLEDDSGSVLYIGSEAYSTGELHAASVTPTLLLDHPRPRRGGTTAWQPGERVVVRNVAFNCAAVAAPCDFAAALAAAMHGEASVQVCVANRPSVVADAVAALRQLPVAGVHLRLHRMFDPRQGECAQVRVRPAAAALLRLYRAHATPEGRAWIAEAVYEAARHARAHCAPAKVVAALQAACA